MTTKINHERPLLLADIDGVFNAFDGWIYESPSGLFNERRYNVKAPAHMREARAAGYRLLLNPDHPAMFEALAEKYEIMWASMWQGRAWEFAEAAGFGHELDYIPFDEFHVGFNWDAPRTGNGVTSYKWPGLMEVIGDRPVVYIDDDLTPEQHAWAEARNASGIPTLFIQPDPREGFTWEQFLQVLAFAQVDASAAGVVL